MQAQPLDHKVGSGRGVSVKVVEDGRLLPPMRTGDVRPPLDTSMHYGTWRNEGKPEQQKNQLQGVQSHRPRQDIAELGDKLRAHA